MVRMNIVSSVLALAILSLVLGFASSAPLSEVKDQVDKEAKVTAADKLLNALQLLLEKRAMTMAINQLTREQGNAWKYPPLIKVESENSNEEEPSPMKKAAHRHFEVSEPGTGPILNHPLNIDMGVDRKTIESLINELMSSAK